MACLQRRRRRLRRHWRASGASLADGHRLGSGARQHTSKLGEPEEEEEAELRRRRRSGGGGAEEEDKKDHKRRQMTI